mgnify:FL=1|jgi:hypothetical protein
MMVSVTDVETGLSVVERETARKLPPHNEHTVPATDTSDPMARGPV